MSVREAALAALFDALSYGGLAVLRNEPKAQEVPAGGLAVLHDGEPGEPERSMSPNLWHYEHRAQIDVFVRDVPGGLDRDAGFDLLCQTIGQAIAADRTLGGAVEWCEPAAPVLQALDEDAAGPVKAASIAVTLVYATTDPLN